MRVAGVGRIVEIELDDRCGKLRSVESLNATGQTLRIAEVGRVVECSWTIWLLARTSSRTWARCCNARAARNSESLRGLDAALLERRGR